MARARSRMPNDPARPVNPVKRPKIAKPKAITFALPSLSPRMPDGTWRSVYVMKNRLLIRPTSAFVRLKSVRISTCTGFRIIRSA